MNFTFTFSGRPWDVKFVSKDHELLKDATGATDFTNSIIYIQNDLGPHYRLVTFWHELTHVFLEPFYATEKTKIHHELACDLTGMGFAQMLTMKSKLPSWVFESTTRPKKYRPLKPSK